MYRVGVSLFYCKKSRFHKALCGIPTAPYNSRTPYDATFSVTYGDKSKLERDFFLPGDDFKECFSIIRQMIPGCEDTPVGFLALDNYNDE